jgi:hypothetical protein
MAMELFHRDDVDKQMLPGRELQWAVGRAAFSASSNMTVGFAHYSVDSGPMEPHKHAEETVYIIAAKDGWFEWGPGKETMIHEAPLPAGTTIHVAQDEWHVFRYGEGGFVDALVIYAPPL